MIDDLACGQGARNKLGANLRRATWLCAQLLLETHIAQGKRGRVVREAPLAASDFAACGLLALVGTDASSRRYASGLHLASPLGPRAKPSNFVCVCVKIRGRKELCRPASQRRECEWDANGVQPIELAEIGKV